jgi:hypothetical protein
VNRNSAVTTVMTKGLQTIKREMLADREVHAAYEALSDEFDLARELIVSGPRSKNANSN